MPPSDDIILIGTPGPDEISDNGPPSAVLIDGLGEDDVLEGFGLNDVLIGNAGNDTLKGGTGDDLFAFKFEFHEAWDEIVPATSHEETLTFSLGAPSANADWKAWEEYEGRLMKFFGGDETVGGSYANLFADGWTFSAEVAAQNAAWDAHIATNPNGPTDVLAGFSLVTLVAPKTSNTKGQDVPKNHDQTNNVELSGVSGGKTFGYLDAGAITGTKTIIVIDTEETVIHHDAYYSSVDGVDEIDDFSIKDEGDKLLLGNIASAQDFKDFFSVVKDAEGHGVTISLDNGDWSAHIDINGVDPQDDSINGKVWADYNADDLEQFVWTVMVDDGTLLASQQAEFQTYVTDWLAVV
jgi:Ca2+-binding RTX toxin-like protein